METTITNHKDWKAVKNAEYNPLLALKLKSVNSAVFFTNCLHHHLEENLKPDNTVIRTIASIQFETALSRYEQETAIKKLKKCELLDYTLEGLPSVRHFKINFNKLAIF